MVCLTRQLKNLKDHMNNTIFKDIVFSDSDKSKVLNKIQDKSEKSNKVSIKHIITTILSIALPAFVIFFFVSNNYLNSHGDSNTDVTKEQIDLTDKKNPEGTIANANEIYTPTLSTIESYQDLGKDDVVQLLTNNSFDRFETAKGSFEEYTPVHGKVKVEYQIITQEANQSGYSKVFIIDENGKELDFVSTYFNKEHVWNINTEHKNYIVDNILTVHPSMIGQSKDSLYPNELSLNYLEDHTKWEITRQNEEIMGHNTVVIEGTLNEYAKEKHNSDHFSFWVDKDTGILIKYETYKDGELVNYLHPIELLINIPINPNDLSPNLDGLEKFRENTIN